MAFLGNTVHTSLGTSERALLRCTRPVAVIIMFDLSMPLSCHGLAVRVPPHERYGDALDP